MYVSDKSLNESITLEKISKLQNENKYLKDEMDEESQKFIQTISVLKREIEFYKNNTDISEVDFSKKDIFMYDFTTESITQITDTDHDEAYPIASKDNILSNTASWSLTRFSQYLTASSKYFLLGEYFLFNIYSWVLESKATRPDFAPASILMLHIVILLSMLIFSMQSPVNSIV